MGTGLLFDLKERRMQWIVCVRAVSHLPAATPCTHARAHPRTWMAGALSKSTVSQSVLGEKLL